MNDNDIEKLKQKITELEKKYRLKVAFFHYAVEGHLELKREISELAREIKLLYIKLSEGL